jgi:hypothetical protein
MKIYFEGNNTPFSALVALGKNLEWAYNPIQVKKVNGVWCVVEVTVTRLYNETLFVVSCAFNQFLADPEHHEYPPHWEKLKVIEHLGGDLSRAALASMIATEFETLYPDIDAENFHDTLDKFIDLKLQQL